MALCISSAFKNRLQHTSLSAKFVKYLRTRILKNICERLVLTMTLFEKDGIAKISRNILLSKFQAPRKKLTCKFWINSFENISTQFLKNVLDY